MITMLFVSFFLRYPTPKYLFIKKESVELLSVYLLEGCGIPEVK